MLEKLLDIVEEICEDDAFREDLEIDLFEEDFLDSLALVELLLALEEAFGIKLPPTEYTKADFSTVKRIEKVLTDKGVS